MAAIDIHIGTQASEDRKDHACTLPDGTLGAARSCTPPLEQTHVGQTRMVWVRRALIDWIEREQVEYRLTTRGRQITIEISKPYQADLFPWLLDKATQPQSVFGIIGEAGKMSCPTWDLPAGSPVLDGSCPSATPGQTTVPAPIRKKNAKAVGVPVRLTETICQICYAEGGNYSTFGTQLRELLVYWWTREWIEGGRVEEWIETMVEAIRRSPFPVERLIDPRTGQPILPMRVHSSGDFFSQAYARAWIEIANRVPEVMFWAPTRIWAAGGGWLEFWRDNRDRILHRNLVVRPSSYHTDDPAIGPGWRDIPCETGNDSPNPRVEMRPETPWAREIGYPFTSEGTAAVYKFNDKNWQTVAALSTEEQQAGALIHSIRTRGSVDPRYSWQCVAAGTRVHVKGQGLIEIEHIGKLTNPEVLTREGWRRIVAWTTVGTRETVLVRTRAGYQIRVTPDHRIATERGWCEAGNLTSEDVIVLAPENPEAALAEGAIPVPAWDRSFVRKGAAAYLPEATLPEHWNRELGLVLGYFVGDAHFAAGGHTVDVRLGNDKRDDLHALDAIVKTWVGHGAHFREEMAGGNTLVPTRSLSFRAIWSDSRLGRYLTAFGYTHGVGSAVRRAPIGIWQAPRSAIEGFLSGLFSADGSVHVERDGRGRLTYCTTSSGLAHDVQLLLALLGARTSRSIELRPPYRDLFRITVRSRAGLEAMKRLQLLNRRKRDALDVCVLSANVRHRNTHVLDIVGDGVVVPVYDLTIEGTSEFAANNIIVHNCSTYATVSDAKSCRNAIAPDGEIGCRVCWLNPELRVNYTAH